MRIEYNINEAKFELSGNSIAELEKGLAEIKRLVAEGVRVCVCHREDADEWEEECDSNGIDWETCWTCDKEDCDECLCPNEEKEEEEETKEEEIKYSWEIIRKLLNEFRKELGE